MGGNLGLPFSTKGPKMGPPNKKIQDFALPGKKTNFNQRSPPPRQLAVSVEENCANMLTMSQMTMNRFRKCFRMNFHSFQFLKFPVN